MNRHLRETVPGLAAALQALADCLGAGPGDASVPHAAPEELAATAAHAARAAPAAAPWALPTTLARLALRLGLSRFEADVLLLAAAPEIDPAIGTLLARVQLPLAVPGAPPQPWATFGLAMQCLPDADWAAIAPVGRLRRWHLLELVGPGGIGSTALRVDETVLHHLLGQGYAEPRLEPWCREVPPAPAPQDPPDPALAALGRAWSAAPSLADTPVAVLDGGDALQQVQALAAQLQLQPVRWSSQPLPESASEREWLARLWERDALLRGAVLWVQHDEAAAAAAAGAAAAEASARLADFIDRLQGLVLVSGAALPLQRARWPLTAPAGDAVSRLQTWRAHLGQRGAAMNGALTSLAEQFELPVTAIAQLAHDWQHSAQPTAVTLWQATRIAARRELDGLAERIAARATWADLVLPETTLLALRTMAAQVRQRHRVLHDWGYAQRSARGLGLGALFAGGSGTGKTMAAEVLANELQLDLVRIDLAALVSKYIGETEKNLSRVFAAAEASGAILLFDEADALFGKRSEVRDSHDRYANLEVSYLLQRIESWRGLAILTSNMRQAIDSAFLRRLRFIVNFPFPDDRARAQIWQRAFPAAAPQEGLDTAKLARLSLSGGNIRNVALNAAFLAADEARAIGMRHLRMAAEAEFAKIEKPLPAGDVGDWL
jgi:hypothetical protein